MKSSEHRIPLGCGYQVSHAADGTEGKSFVRFWATGMARNRLETRFTGCCVFASGAPRSIPDRTFTDGRDVFVAYVEPLPLWLKAGGTNAS